MTGGALIREAEALIGIGGRHRMNAMRRMLRALVAASTMVGVVVTVGALGQPAHAAAPPASVVALTGAGALLRFDASTPGTVATPIPVTGLLAGEKIVGIDVRPATGQLFGVGITGSNGRIMVIDPASGAVTAVGTTPFSTTLPAGGSWSADFNPAVDRIRLIQSGVGGTNLRINPNNGALAGLDVAISGGSVIGAAYDRSVGSATVTTLYAINDTTDALSTVGGINGAPSPNGGVVAAVGPLGVTIDPGTTIGFDIAPSPSPLGTAYAAFRTGGSYQIYTVNLATGAAAAQGLLTTGSSTIIDLAVFAVAPPGPLLALTAVNSIVRFDAATPGSVSAALPITGLQNGETVVGIDVRPATGELFGVGIAGSNGRVLRIDPVSGAATAIGATPFSVTLPATSLWSVDFDPTVDRIRLTQNGPAGLNLRLHPNTGALVSTDTPTSGGSVIGAAYDRSSATVAATTLYAINDDTDSLATIGGVNGTPSPNGGIVTNVGSLGVAIDAGSPIGFDIAPAPPSGSPGTGVAFAALRRFNTYRIYTVDLATGFATAGELIAWPAGVNMLDLAVPIPFPAGGSQFTPVTPTRLLDTREGIGAPRAKPGPGATVDLQVTGAIVPSNATAVVLNIVGTEAFADGFLTAFPTGEARPLAANQNLVTGQTRGNLATVKIGAGGRVSIFTQSGTHLVADVFGYYAPPSSPAGRFTAMTPSRLLDTRTTSKPVPGGTVAVQATGVAGVPPTGVSSVVVALTATEATAAGFITGYATGTTRPFTANLNVERTDQTIGNLAILPLDAAGSFTLFTQSGTHLVVDVVGWFGDSTARGGRSGLFVPTSPARLLDTREPPATKLGPGASRELQVGGVAGVPSTGASAVVVNLTAVEVTAPGFLTLYPSGIARPLASSVYGDAAGQTIPSLAYGTLGTGGRVTIFSNAGSHVVVDLAGYYLS